jgi:hypothetical protein
MAVSQASDESRMRDRVWSGGGHERHLEKRRDGLLVWGLPLGALVQIRGKATEPLSCPGPWT